MPTPPLPGPSPTHPPRKQIEDPTQLLVVDGRSCKLHRSIEQHAALERGDGLIPWNGAHVGRGRGGAGFWSGWVGWVGLAAPPCVSTHCGWVMGSAHHARCLRHAFQPVCWGRNTHTHTHRPQDNLIDRFDGRALLDFYREPPPGFKARRERSHQEERLEEVRPGRARRARGLLSRGVAHAGLRERGDRTPGARNRRGSGGKPKPNTTAPWARAPHRNPVTLRPAALSPSRPAAPTRDAALQALAFEAFRDAIRFAARGLPDREGIRAARDEHIARRAHLQSALQAVEQVVFKGRQQGGGAAAAAGPSAAQAGTGQYAAVGFSYGGGGEGEGVGSDSDDSDSDSDDGGGGPEDEAEAAQEAEDDRVDDIAERYGLADFSYRLHRTLEKEGDDEARMRPRARCGPAPRARPAGRPGLARARCCVVSCRATAPPSAGPATSPAAAAHRSRPTPLLPAPQARHQPQKGARARQAHGRAGARPLERAAAGGCEERPPWGPVPAQPLGRPRRGAARGGAAAVVARQVRSWARAGARRLGCLAGGGCAVRPAWPAAAAQLPCSCHGPE